MARTLEGLLVVSLEQAVAAPYCSSRLADAGARVIKIERREGDFARKYDNVANGQSAYFVWLNRGKESIALDLKSSADMLLLDRLLAKADVFIQNLSPGATARLGIGSEALRERYDRLITCDISGYGENGDYSAMKAYDLLVQCETGLASITGVEEAPGRVGVSVADIGCGMNAQAAILDALIRRGQTGRGASIKVSLFDTIAEWMNVPYLHGRYGKAPERVGLRHPSIAPYGAFELADGKLVVISVQNEREWIRLREALLPTLDEDLIELFSSNVGRVANRDKLDGLVAEEFAKLDVTNAVAILQNCKVAYGMVNTVDDLIRHPQLRLIEMDDGAQVIAPAIQISDSEGPAGQIPKIDEHGADIRSEFS